MVHLLFEMSDSTPLGQMGDHLFQLGLRFLDSQFVVPFVNLKRKITDFDNLILCHVDFLDLSGTRWITARGGCGTD